MARSVGIDIFKVIVKTGKAISRAQKEAKRERIKQIQAQERFQAKLFKEQEKELRLQEKLIEYNARQSKKMQEKYNNDLQKKKNLKYNEQVQLYIDEGKESFEDRCKERSELLKNVLQSIYS